MSSYEDGRLSRSVRDNPLAVYVGNLAQCEKQNQLGRTVWMTQVIMLNNLAMSHSGDRRELEIAEILQAVSIALARRKGVFEDVLPHDRIAKLQLPLEQAWRLWAVDEERRRTGYAVWVSASWYVL
jgi:hypothetical protein